MNNRWSRDPKSVHCPKWSVDYSCGLYRKIQNEATFPLVYQARCSLICSRCILDIIVVTARSATINLQLSHSIWVPLLVILAIVPFSNSHGFLAFLVTHAHIQKTTPKMIADRNVINRIVLPQLTLWRTMGSSNVPLMMRQRKLRKSTNHLPLLLRSSRPYLHAVAIQITSVTFRKPLIDWIHFLRGSFLLLRSIKRLLLLDRNLTVNVLSESALAVATKINNTGFTLASAKFLLELQSNFYLLY